MYLSGIIGKNSTRYRQFMIQHSPFLHFKFIIIILLLSGCSMTSNTKPISHFYDYQLYNATLSPLPLSEWQQEFTNADVILIGE